jgi:hypothetical protein
MKPREFTDSAGFFLKISSGLFGAEKHFQIRSFSIRHHINTG